LRARSLDVFMDRDEFEIYPKIGGNLVSAVYRCFLYLSVFEDFLRSSRQHAEAKIRNLRIYPSSFALLSKIRIQNQKVI
jgi:hypothetical protein